MPSVLHAFQLSVLALVNMARPHRSSGFPYKFQTVLLRSCWLLTFTAAVTFLLLKSMPKNRSDVVPVIGSSSGGLRYDQTLLDDTSMWGMGLNARTISSRRQNVPLVAWSDKAIQTVRDDWNKAQSASNCERALYTSPSFWGLTSQMRDYGDAAILSLAFRRPLSHRIQGRYPRWCRKHAWFGCFFEGFGEPPRCVLVPKKMKQFDLDVTSLEARVQTHRRLAGPGPVVVRRFSLLDLALDDPRFFPQRLWERLIADRLVTIIDEHDHVLDPNVLKMNEPQLYHTIAVSALRTMLVPILFQPQKWVRNEVAAKMRMFFANQQSLTPCVAVHLRWTDKHLDGGVASALAYSVDHVSKATYRIERKRGRSYACAVVLTDDDVNALPPLRRALSKRVDLYAPTRVSELFGPNDDYPSYTRMGHRYFSERVARADPIKAYFYFANTVVDIYVAAALSDALIGIGSSGVSQLVSQLIGHARGVDANAVALWQEDMLENPMTTRVVNK